MSFKNVGVVGSNGFMGSNLTKKLLQIPGIDLFLFGKNESSVFGASAVYSKIDITNADSVKHGFTGMDIVYYLASETNPATSWEHPVLEIEKNLLPFLKFLEYIVPLKVKKVVFISSGGTVYGATDQRANEESFKNPFSPHGITKLSMEYFLNYFNKKYNLGFDIYRVSNVFGEGQNTGKGVGIINTFLENILLHNRVNIYGDGNNVRNYLYVKDFAELVTLSLFSDPGKSNIYNTASNDTITINELVQVIKRAICAEFETVYTDTRQSDNPAIYLDNAKILNAFPGFTFTPIEEGILNTYLYLKGQNK